jgi:MoaA/NifB/PqqE/SkfB family radical SAM enzyme
MKPDPPFLAQKLENSRLLREDIARKAVRFRALPEVVTLNHSDLCNLRCVMCPRNLAQGTHRLSRRVLSYIADELFPTARKLVLTTSGGDPLAADYDFLLDRALTYGVQMDAVTNGVLLTPEVYRRSRGALDHLNVSLDSHVPEVYERIRLGARFDQVLGNLRAIQAERASHPDDVLYSTSAVVMRSNLPHLAEFVRFAAGLGFEAVVFQRLLHSVKPTPEEDPETHCGADAIRESFTRAEAAAREVGVNLYLTEFGLPSVLARPLRSKRPDPLLGQRLCWFMAQNFGVMYTGEVYPCCVPTDHSLGNVLYDDPVSIWNGRAAQDLRAAQMSGRGTVFCSGCLHAPHLAGASARTRSQEAAARRSSRGASRPRVAAPAVAHETRSVDVDRSAAASDDDRVTVASRGRPESQQCRRRRPPRLRNDVAAVAPDGSLLADPSTANSSVLRAAIGRRATPQLDRSLACRARTARARC